MDGEAIAHYYSSSEKSYSGDNLCKNTEIVVVYHTATDYRIGYHRLGDKDKDTGTNRNEGIGGETRTTLAYLAFQANKDAANKGYNKSRNEYL